MYDNLYKINDTYREGLGYYLSFLLWPLGLMFAAFRYWERPWAKNVFWFFCAFFGFTFIIGEIDGADSGRYASLFVQYAHSKTNFLQFISSFYTASISDPDFVSPLIMFLISRFTDNTTILFTVYGVLFGYFYSRNIWYVLERTESRISGLMSLYVLTLILINPIWNINGFRFWMAAQVFLYGTLPYLLDGKRNRLIWALSSMFVHFAFVFPLAVLSLYLLLKNRSNLYLVFYLITAFINALDLQWLQSALSFLPDIFYSKIITYTNPDYEETRRIIDQELPWFITYANLGVKWVNYSIVISIFYVARDFLREKKDLNTLLCFSLLFLGFTNILSVIPSVDRFEVVGNTFIFSFHILFFSTIYKIRKFLFLKVITTPFLILFCMLALRRGMDYCGIITVIGNPVSAAFYSDGVSLITYFKNISF